MKNANLTIFKTLIINCLKEIIPTTLQSHNYLFLRLPVFESVLKKISSVLIKQVKK
jgi:hypothetical protein